MAEIFRPSAATAYSQSVLRGSGIYIALNRLLSSQCVWGEGRSGALSEGQSVDK